MDSLSLNNFTPKLINNFLLFTANSLSFLVNTMKTALKARRRNE